MNAHPIPFAALDGKVGVMGVTGSGKTFTAIGLVEQLLDAGRQVIVVDPTGVYNGLRTAFPLPIFGGRFGDVEIAEDSGAAVARLIIERDLSAIVDVSALLKRSHAAARRFMGPFVATMKNAPERARYIVMDEADEFMPEHASGDVAHLFGDLKWIVRRGRSSGWRMLMVTQRPQDIAKSVLTQCETMVIHRLMAPQDRKALLEWVKGNADADQAREVIDSLARLETGEAWIWSPKHDLLVRARMPANRSEDRSKTPDADDGPRAALGFKPIDLNGIREALASPASNSATAIVGGNIDVDTSDIFGKLATALAENEGLRADVRAAEAAHDRLHEIVQRVKAALSEIPGDWPGGVPVGDGGQKIGASVSAPAGKPQPERERPARIEPQGATDGETSTDMPKGARQLLDQIAKAHPRAIALEQAAKLAGVSTKSSLWTRNREGAKASGLIEPLGDRWRLSPAGVAAYPSSNDGWHPVAAWCAVLPPSAGRLLRAMVERGDQWTDREALADAAGISRTSSMLGGSLAELAANGLGEKRGRDWRATDAALS